MRYTNASTATVLYTQILISNGLNVSSFSCPKSSHNLENISISGIYTESDETGRWSLIDVDLSNFHSLKKLKTDYIDLYQLHWPNRGSYHFRQNWNYDPTLQSTEEALDHFLDVLETIKKLISEGKIRHFGLSNESAWGVATWIKLSEKYNLPRVLSIQNEYTCLIYTYDSSE